MTPEQGVRCHKQFSVLEWRNLEDVNEIQQVGDNILIAAYNISLTAGDKHSRQIK